METKELIENMRICYKGKCDECTMVMKSGCIDDLLRVAAEKLWKNEVEINNQRCEIEALKKELAELKKELAERKAAPGWISVEERLPEIGKNVLIKYENDFTVGYLQMNNTWVLYYGNGWTTPADESENPTHWMPIPETPKKVKTYTDVFLERMKEAFPELDVNHVKPAYCRAQVFSEEVDCDGIYGDCKACWNKAYPEEEGGEE